MNEYELKTTDFPKRNYIIVLFTIFAALNFLTLACEDYIYFLYVKKTLSMGYEFASWHDFIPSFFICFVPLIPVIAAIFISCKVEKTENKNHLKNLKILVLCYVFTDLGLSVVTLLENILNINLHAYLPHFLQNIFIIFYTHDWSNEIFALIQFIHDPHIPDYFINSKIYFILAPILHEAYYIIFWILNFLLIKRINLKIKS